MDEDVVVVVEDVDVGVVLLVELLVDDVTGPAVDESLSGQKVVVVKTAMTSVTVEG